MPCAPRKLLRLLRLSHSALNLRTYVRPAHGNGPPGIFFFTLECSSLLPVLGARMLFNLPYRWASMLRSDQMDGSAESNSAESSRERLGVGTLRAVAMRVCACFCGSRELVVSGAAAAEAEAVGSSRRKIDTVTSCSRRDLDLVGPSTEIELSHQISHHRLQREPSSAPLTEPGERAYSFASSRRGGGNACMFSAVWRVASIPEAALPGSLAEFVIERYCLYAQGSPFV